MAATRKSTTKSANTNGASKKVEGKSLADICKKLKMEPRTARRILRNSEIEVDGGRWVFGAAQAAKVEKLLKDKQAASA